MEDGTYCYCKALVKEPYMIKCQSCNNLFHSSCLRSECQVSLMGDVFFNLTCQSCSPSNQEICFRDKPLTWLYAIILAIYNLQIKESGKQGFFHWKDHICSIIGKNWTSLFGKNGRKKGSTQWQNTVAGYLSIYSGVIFRSGFSLFKEPGWWSLLENKLPSEEEFEKLKKMKRSLETTPVQESVELSVPVVEREEVVSSSFSPFEHEVQVKQETNEDINLEEWIQDKSGFQDEEASSAKEFSLNKLFNLDDDSDTEMDIDSCVILQALDKETTQQNKIHSKDNDEPSLGGVSPPTSILKELPKNESLTERFKTSMSERPQVLNNVPKDQKHSSQDAFLAAASSPFAFLSTYEEGLLMKKVEKYIRLEKSEFLSRLRCKLLVRKRKRERNLPLFNLDAEVNGTAPAVEIIKRPHHYFLDKFHSSSCVNKPMPYLQRLCGQDSKETILSPYSCRTLEPCMHQDFESKPLKLKLFEELFEALRRKGMPVAETAERAPITYNYVRPGHIHAVNSTCHHFFWPGIDMSDCLQYPEFSCIAQYKKLLIGFAFAVPDTYYNEVYIPFIFTHPEWRNSGIATFMMAHILKQSQGKDVTLHVSITNSSRALYENFGFKVEKMFLDFYDKYFDHSCKDSRHSYCMRLSR